MHVDDNIRAGMTPDEARRARPAQARRASSRRRSSTATAAACRWLEMIVQDGRLALRMMRRTPGLHRRRHGRARPRHRRQHRDVQRGQHGAAAAAALPGSGAAPARADRRRERQSLAPRRRTSTSTGRAAAPSSPCAAFYSRPFDLTGGEEPERIRVLIVSSEFLGTLRTPPAVGRDFLPADERWGDHRVVILTDGFWRRRFAADPAIVGQPITLNAEPYTVVGILPAAVLLPRRRRAGRGADVVRPRRQHELAQQLLPDHGRPAAPGGAARPARPRT